MSGQIVFFIILIAANDGADVHFRRKGTVTGPIIGTIVIIFFNEFILANFGASELNIVFHRFTDDSHFAVFS